MKKNISILGMLVLVLSSFMVEDLKSEDKFNDIKKIIYDIENVLPDSVVLSIRNNPKQLWKQHFLSSADTLGFKQFMIIKAKVDSIIDANIDSLNLNCNKYFPSIVCRQWALQLIVLNWTHKSILRSKIDFQHEVDSLANLLYTLDSIRACNMVADSINGVYIPHSIEEALDIMIAKIPKDELEKFRKAPEEKFVAEQHFGYGMYMRNQWLGNASRLHVYIETISNGIDHPDDQSTLILIMLHRKLNGKPLDKWKLFEEQNEKIRKHKEEWEKLNKK